MAPMTIDDRATKRSVPMNDFDLPIAKKRKLTVSHRLIIDQASCGSESLDVTFNGDAQVELLLTRSIALALEALGFEASEPLALESFRLVAQEYALVPLRREAVYARLSTNRLSLRALLPHLDPPVARKRAQLTLAYESKQEEEQCDHRFLGPELNGTSDQESRSYIPHHFPSLPSKHTYQATAEYPSREEDPRKIRERAAEEGRLAEEALRRLISAKSSDRPPSLRDGRRSKSIREQRDDLWKETMQAADRVSKAERLRGADAMDQDDSRTELVVPGRTVTDEGRISSAVNAEKKYWRRAAPPKGSGQGTNDGVS
ncbi:MAG: hypothetical protein Q9192_005962 [Flavoplaca navasiana]